MRTAVITGSTRGIGLGLARELLARGCNVVVTGRSQSGLDSAVAELANPARVLAVPLDVTDAASVQKVWDEAAARFGSVDIWINNAGSTTTPLPLWQVELDEVTTTIETNLLGTIYGTQVAIRGMSAQPNGGHIFNVEGLGSKGETQVGLTTYGCTKAAVNYLDKALLKELKDSKVLISSIRPGINVTEHLLHGAHVLSEERWAKTKKIMNILGDKPETTTPFLADKILAANKTGTRIAWLTNAKVAGRFMTAGFRKRDLFADIDDKVRTPAGR